MVNNAEVGVMLVEGFSRKEAGRSEMGKSKREMNDDDEGKSTRSSAPSKRNPGQKVAVGTLPFKSVKVFEERAEVRREVKLKLEKGTVELQFFRFPTGVERESIRVEVKGKSTIKYAVSDEKEERAIKETEVRKLSKEIKKMRRERVEKEMVKKQLETQRQMWTKAAEAAKGGEKTGVADVAAMSAFSSAYETEAGKLNAAEYKMMGEVGKLSSKLGKAEVKLEEMNRCQYRYTIILDVKDADSVEMEVIYFVSGSSWSAAYDVRLNTATKKMNIGYFAMVKQRSGEDWSDVKMVVASGPGGAGKMPMQRGLFVLKKMNPDEQGREPPERTINVNYEISGRKTVIGDGSEHKILVTDIELEPAIDTFVIPKESLAAFIKAKAVLKSAYTLLPGPVMVFRDSSFVSKNQMKRTVCPKEDFMCALGPEPGIRVEYQSKEDHITEKKEKNKWITECRINVKNKGKERLRVTVLEQVPISRDPGPGGVKVAVLKPHIDGAGTPTTKAGEPAKLNRFNYIEWSVDLPVDEGKTLEAKYTVEFPIHDEILFQ